MSNNPNTYDEIVSLGSNCEVAIGLKNRNIKDKTYPYDWVWSNISYVTDSFKNKRKIHPLSEMKQLIGDDHIYYYTDQVMLVHDFDDCLDKKNKIGDKTIEDKKEIVSETYYRRFERLHQLCSSDKKVLFVRLFRNGGYIPMETDDFQKVIRLIETIKECYPILNFKMLFLHNARNNLNVIDHPLLIHDIGDTSEHESIQCYRILEWFNKK